MLVLANPDLGKLVSHQEKSQLMKMVNEILPYKPYLMHRVASWRNENGLLSALREVALWRIIP